MLPPPLPEKAADFRNIGAPGDILQGTIIDGHHGGSLKRFTAVIGKFYFKSGFFARPVSLFCRFDVDLEHPFFRRHDNFTGFGVDLALIDGNGLDEKIGHIFLGDLNFCNRTFAGHLNNFGW